MQNSNTNKELATLAHDWLSLTGNQVHAAYCTDAITTHPDYPALTALTDFLESGGMAYEAVQADASYIQEFNYPLLAHIKRPGDEYLYLVNGPHSWEKEKETTKDWSGIVLYTAKGAVWRHPENDQRRKMQQKNRMIAIAGIIAGMLLFTASVYINPHLWISIFGLLSLTGLAISMTALGTELGYQSKLVKQVCGAAGNGGCEKVLKSKFAKGIAGITPADMSVLYFTTQLTIYLTGCFYQPLLTGMFPVAALGMVAVAWSIYTQAFRVKEWCPLCLGIVSVLLLQAAIAVTETDLSAITGSYTSYLFFMCGAGLFSLIFIPIKQLIKTNTKYRQEISTFKKWKSDATLFLSQLEQEPPVDITVWENDLLLGSPDAPLRITVACNPYCGPCAKAHKTLDELLEKYPGKISVQIRLLCDAGSETDKRTIATRAILQQAALLKDNSVLQQMLTDWFHRMNLEQWQQQWNEEQEINVKQALLQHQTWVNQAGIAYTPTFFINGRKMPGRYELEDIEKLAPQLSGMTMV